MDAPAPVTVDALLWVRRRIATRQVSQDTGMRQRYILVRFAATMGRRRAENIGKSDIERWLATIAKKAPGTRRRYYAVVRLFFDDLVEEGRIKRNPVRRCPIPTEPRTVHRAYTAEQAAAILNACPDDFARCYITLSLQCGFRGGEMAGIEDGDIDWHSEPMPTVIVTGKGGHQRIVALPVEAQQAIRAYLLTRPRNQGPLLRHRALPNVGVRRRYLSEDFAAIAYAAGVKQAPNDGVSLHACRHTAATDIFRECLDLTIVRDVLGHASTATTDRYVAGLDRAGVAAAMVGRTYRRAA